MMRRLRKARGKGFVCVENVKRMGALHPSPLKERELVSSHETNMESERKYSERTGSKRFVS